MKRSMICLMVMAGAMMAGAGELVFRGAFTTDGAIALVEGSDSNLLHSALQPGEVKELHDMSVTNIIVTSDNGLIEVKQLVNVPYYTCILSATEPTWVGETWEYAGVTGTNDVYESSVIGPDLTQSTNLFAWAIDTLTNTTSGRFSAAVAVSEGGGVGGGGREAYFVRAYSVTTNVLDSIQLRIDANSETGAVNKASIAALEAVALTNELDPRALKNYHYGDPDITITSTNDFTFDSGTGTITAYSGTDATVVIPYEIGGVDVVAIGTTAFINKTTIISLSFPKSILLIDSGAFNGCTSLLSVTIPLVGTVSSGAFADCTSLISVVITSVENIGDSSFSGCTVLNSVSFGSDLPTEGATIYDSSPLVTNYVLNVEAEGWGDTFGGRPVVMPSVDANEGSFKGTVIMIGALEGNTANFTGAVSAASLDVAGAATIDTLVVTNVLTVNSSAIVTNNLIVGHDLTVTNSTSIGSNLDVGGDIRLLNAGFGEKLYIGPGDARSLSYVGGGLQIRSEQTGVFYLSAGNNDLGINFATTGSAGTLAWMQAGKYFKFDNDVVMEETLTASNIVVETTLVVNDLMSEQSAAEDTTQVLALGVPEILEVFEDNRVDASYTTTPSNCTVLVEGWYDCSIILDMWFSVAVEGEVHMRTNGVAFLDVGGNHVGGDFDAPNIAKDVEIFDKKSCYLLAGSVISWWIEVDANATANFPHGGCRAERR